MSAGKSSDVVTYGIVEQPGTAPILEFKAGGYSKRCSSLLVERPEISIDCSTNRIRLEVSGGESIQLDFNPESREMTPDPALLRRLARLERLPAGAPDLLPAIERLRTTLSLFDDLNDDFAKQKGWRDMLGIRQRLTALAARADLARGDWPSAEAEIRGGILTPALFGPQRDELDAELERTRSRPGPLHLSHPVRLSELRLDPRRTLDSGDLLPWSGARNLHLLWRGTFPCVAEGGANADRCYDASSGEPRIASPTDRGVVPGSTFVTAGACGELVSMGGAKAFEGAAILAALPGPAVLLERRGRFVAEGSMNQVALSRAAVNARLLGSSGSRILGRGRFRLATDDTQGSGPRLIYAETEGGHRVWQLPLPGLPPNSRPSIALISPDQTQLLAAVVPHAAPAVDHLELWLFHIDEIAANE